MWLIETRGSQFGDVVQSYDLLRISGRGRLPLFCFSSCHLQQEMQFSRAHGQTMQLLLVLCHTKRASVLEYRLEQPRPASSRPALHAPLSLISLHAAASTGLDSVLLETACTVAPETLEDVTWKRSLLPSPQGPSGVHDSLPDNLTSLGSLATIVPQVSEAQQPEE